MCVLPQKNFEQPVDSLSTTLHCCTRMLATPLRASIRMLSEPYILDTGTVTFAESMVPQ